MAGLAQNSMPFLDTENTHRDCDAAAADDFDGRALIIASNRGPITFDGTAAPRFRRGAGGLVTALTGLAQQMDATWIACARTSADADWQEGLVALPGSERRLRVSFLCQNRPSMKAIMMDCHERKPLRKVRSTISG